jgi:hypothetical protein
MVVSFMKRLIAPSQIEIGWGLKKAIGCISKERVKFGNTYVNINNDLLCYHDLYHLEVSCLPRIQIGKHLVSGIHGIDSPFFHDSPIVPEYDGIFDEVRVAFHEWLTRPAFFNTFKIVSWMYWLVAQGINPIAVLIRHYRSLNPDIVYKDVRTNITFFDEEVDSRNLRKTFSY